MVQRWIAHLFLHLPLSLKFRSPVWCRRWNGSGGISFLHAAGRDFSPPANPHFTSRTLLLHVAVCTTCKARRGALPSSPPASVSLGAPVPGLAAGEGGGGGGGGGGSISGKRRWKRRGTAAHKTPGGAGGKGEKIGAAARGARLVHRRRPRGMPDCGNGLAAAAAGVRLPPHPGCGGGGGGGFSAGGRGLFRTTLLVETQRMTEVKWKRRRRGRKNCPAAAAPENCVHTGGRRERGRLHEEYCQGFGKGFGGSCSTGWGRTARLLFPRAGMASPTLRYCLRREDYRGEERG